MTEILGLAYRARKVVTGTSIVLNHLRKGNLELIILATDASKNTKKMIYDKSKYYNVEVVEQLSSVVQSKAVGKQNIMVLGILDKGFSQLLKKREGSGNNGETTIEKRNDKDTATNQK